MYSIYVRPLSGTNPYMHSGAFENRRGELGTATIVQADSARESVFNLFVGIRWVSRDSEPARGGPLPAGRRKLAGGASPAVCHD